jgi:carboxyl-terminal processing protease
MMPASNNGAGMNIGFPDVCLTPPPPPVGPVPVPYPNLAQNAMSAVFSPNIFVGFMPALNMASIKPMTGGDNSGVLHPLFMQAGGQTMGNPIVFINCIPAENLLVPTYGNAFNNPVGATLVPSVTTTLYTDASANSERDQPLQAPALRALSQAVESADVVTAAARDDGVLSLRIARFTSDVATRFYNAVRHHKPTSVFIDLRDNPGGDVRACLELLDDFVPKGELIAVLEEPDDRTPIHARADQAYDWPLTVRVNANTASAAELFAGSLQALGRASVVGCRTRGKGTAQRVCANRDGEGFAYRSVAAFLLPDGRAIHGHGIEPDLLVEE